MSRKFIKSVLIPNLKIHLCCLHLLLFGLIIKPAYSQVSDSGEISQTVAEDANVLLREYLKPFGGGFGADINTGWFSSARPLQPFGVDLRVSVSASLVPAKDQFFDVTNLNLNTVKLLNGPSETPTIFGDDTETSTLGSTYFNSSTQQEEELFSFEMPRGNGYHFVPAPMAQFTMGLPGHTQIILRYSPELVIEHDYRVSVFGIGGMVGLNQLLFKGALPVDLSLQAGIMDFNANIPFNVLPETNEHIENPFPDSHWDGQVIDFDSNTSTANIIIGKTFSILSLFAGIGYRKVSTTITTEGPFPIVVATNDANSNDVNQEVQSVEIPINISLDSASKMHRFGGLQLTLGFISISADYTAGEYATFRAGVGIQFRP